MFYSIRTRACASLVLLSSFSALYGAEEPPLKRTLSFNSGYLTGVSNYAFSNSNRALSDFYDEMGMGYAAVFDALAETSWLNRNHWCLGFINLPINLYLSVIQNTGYHEFGHFTRFRAFGYDARFENSRRPGWENGFKNPFSFTASLLTQPIALVEESATKGNSLWSPHEQIDRLDQFIITSAAGINNQMRFSGDLSNKLYRYR